MTNILFIILFMYADCCQDNNRVILTPTWGNNLTLDNSSSDLNYYYAAPELPCQKKAAILFDSKEALDEFLKKPIPEAQNSNDAVLLVDIKAGTVKKMYQKLIMKTIQKKEEVLDHVENCFE